MTPTPLLDSLDRCPTDGKLHDWQALGGPVYAVEYGCTKCDATEERDRS